MDGADAVWLAVIGCHLGEKLAVADTCRGCETCCLLDTNLDFLGDIHSHFYPFLVVSDIQEGFIDGDGFDEVGVFLEYLMYLMRYFCIIRMPARHDDEVRTALLGLSDGLRRVNAPFASLIAGCRNHTTRTIEAHRYRFAPKFRIISLLYCCKEGIHIYMYDLALFHCLIYYALFVKALSYDVAKLLIISFLCKSFFLFLIIFVHVIAIMLQ